MTKQELKQRAKEQWDCWRLIFDAGMDYNVVFNQMTPNEISVTNAAYDLYIEAVKKASKKK